MKAAVVRDAKARGLSINHVVVEILSKEFRVRFAGTGRKTNAPWAKNGRTSSSPHMPVPVPERLHRKIEAEAARRQVERRRESKGLPIYSINEVAERVLCEHYGLPYVER